MDLLQLFEQWLSSSISQKIGDKIVGYLAMENDTDSAASLTMSASFGDSSFFCVSRSAEKKNRYKNAMYKTLFTFL